MLRIWRFRVRGSGGAEMTRFAVLGLLVLVWASPPVRADNNKKQVKPTATLSFIILKDDNGKPVRNAAVVLHPVNEAGQQERGSLELKTDQEGKASYDGIP